MHSGIVAVWDQDREYAAKLTEYLCCHIGPVVQAVMYSDPDILKRAADSHQVAVALVGRPVADSSWLQGTAVLTLTEERSGMPAQVYKYQPACEILRALTEFRAGAAMSGFSICRPAVIRAVYSPLGGCLKTSLGLVMGSLLSEKEKCLFLSLDTHSGFCTLFGRQYPTDLSDLLAAERQGGNLQEKVSQALQLFGNLCYIPPVVWPEDIRQTDPEQWKALLCALAQDGGFDEIILDVGTGLAGPEEVLSCCDRIYRPEKEDVVSRAKIAEYEDYLRYSGRESILERTRRIFLPEPLSGADPAGPDQWQHWEALFPVVREILREEAGDDQ